VITARYIDQPRQFQPRASPPVEYRRAAEAGSLGVFYFNDDLKTKSSYEHPSSVAGSHSTPFDGFDPVIRHPADLHFPYTQKTQSFAVFGQSDYKLSETPDCDNGPALFARPDRSRLFELLR